jgi:predicted anti-sigma-YlaC factor YlaD
VQFSPIDCARAREFVSAQLDGELSELGLDRLETHLLLCPACTAWAERARDVTGRLREAPLEVPAVAGFRSARRSRRWAVSGSVALASAAAVVATMFVAPGQQAAVAQHRVSASRFTGAEEARVVIPRVPRLGPLEDGLYTPVSARQPQGRLRPV